MYTYRILWLFWFIMDIRKLGRREDVLLADDSSNPRIFSEFAVSFPAFADPGPAAGIADVVRYQLCQLHAGNFYYLGRGRAVGRLGFLISEAFLS